MTKLALFSAGVSALAIALSPALASADVIKNVLDKTLVSTQTAGHALSLTNPKGTILGTVLKKPNTYDFVFTLAPPLGSGERIQVQAQIQNPKAAEPIGFQLYAGDPLGVHSAVGAHFSGASSTPDVVSLTAGEYFLQVTPSDIAVSGETFGGTISVLSAAPEPAAWALMMIGVGGMGAVLRSRRRAATAA